MADGDDVNDDLDETTTSDLDEDPNEFDEEDEAVLLVKGAIADVAHRALDKLDND